MKSISLIFWFIICLFSSVHAQQHEIKETVYFDFNSSKLNAKSEKTLEDLASTLRGRNILNVTIHGHTDQIGSDEFNQKLSEQRTFVVEQFLKSHGINNNVITNSAFGKKQLLSTALEENERLKNRRVEIVVTYDNSIIPFCNTRDDPSKIQDLFLLLQKTFEEFCIDPSSDTTLKCNEGTLLYFKANSFKLMPYNDGHCITIKIVEAYSFSDMLRENLSTTSNGELLETQGMIRAEAYDFKGVALELSRGSDYVIFAPVSENNPKMKIFDGERDETSINWVLPKFEPTISFAMQGH